MTPTTWQSRDQCATPLRGVIRATQWRRTILRGRCAHVPKQHAGVDNSLSRIHIQMTQAARPKARRDLASLPDSHSTSYSLASESSAFTICTSFMPLSRTISALALFFPVISIAVALIRPDAS